MAYNYHELIVKKVEVSSGIRSIELSLAVMSDIGPGSFNMHSYQKELDWAIKQGEVIELLYGLPGATKLSSIYFPKGTGFFSLDGKKYSV